MAEKVIHEVRFIETDDGFRIEVKGDKERLKEMGWGQGMGFGPGMFHMRGMPFGPGKGFAKRMRRARRHGRKHGFGPWAWWNWFDEEDEPAEAEEPPKKA